MIFTLFNGAIRFLHVQFTNQTRQIKKKMAENNNAKKAVKAENLALNAMNPRNPRFAEHQARAAADAKAAVAAAMFAQLPIDAAQRPPFYGRFKKESACCTCGDENAVTRISTCGCFVCTTCLYEYVRVGCETEAESGKPFMPMRCINHLRCGNENVGVEFVLRFLRWRVAKKAYTEEQRRELGLAVCDAAMVQWVRTRAAVPSVASVAKGGVFRCPNAECNFAFLCPNQLVAVDMEILTCPECVVSICGGCMGATHDGKTCAELDADRAREVASLLDAVRQVSSDGGAQQCPTCTRIVERMEGCDFMSCVCGGKFCYQCGDKLNRYYRPYDEEADSCTCGAFARDH